MRKQHGDSFVTPQLGSVQVNVINFEDRMAARLGKRAAAYGMDIVREPAGTWALVAWGFRSPELSGVTLREIAADLDVCDELAVIDDDEILLE